MPFPDPSPKWVHTYVYCTNEMDLKWKEKNRLEQERLMLEGKLKLITEKSIQQQQRMEEVQRRKQQLDQIKLDMAKRLADRNAAIGESVDMLLKQHLASSSIEIKAQKVSNGVYYINDVKLLLRNTNGNLLGKHSH